MIPVFSEHLIDLQDQVKKLREELARTKEITTKSVKILDNIADLTEKLPEVERNVLRARMRIGSGLFFP